MDGGLAGRYWCHMCSEAVNPDTDVAEIKCPQCNSGFVEHVEDGGSGVENRADLSSEEEQRALSLWAPILLGMLASRRQQQQQQRSGAAVLQLLQALREPERDRERAGHVILISPFSQAVIIQAPFGDSSGGASLGDYFVGPGLEQLLQQLAENDPNRQGTPPADKAAVAAMATVSVVEATSCPVCLEEMDVGEAAREMPCRHRFHGGCIVPWLEMHSTCPVCRYQMPVDGDKDAGGRARSDDGSGGAGGESNNGRRFWLPVPWPFSGLFSMSLSSSSSQQSNANENGSNPSSGMTVVHTDENGSNSAANSGENR